MINLGQKKKQGPVRGCIVPLLVVVGIIGSCYGLCMILFLLQPLGVRTTGF